MVFYKKLDNPIRLQKYDFKINWLVNYGFTSLTDRVDNISEDWNYIGPITLVEWNDVAE